MNRHNMIDNIMSIWGYAGVYVCVCTRRHTLEMDFFLIHSRLHHSLHSHVYVLVGWVGYVVESCELISTVCSDMKVTKTVMQTLMLVSSHFFLSLCTRLRYLLICPNMFVNTHTHMDTAPGTPETRITRHPKCVCCQNFWRSKVLGRQGLLFSQNCLYENKKE